MLHQKKVMAVALRFCSGRWSTRRGWGSSNTDSRMTLADWAGSSPRTEESGMVFPGTLRLLVGLPGHRNSPQLDRLIRAPRDERLAVRVARRGPHPVRVSLEGGQFLARRHVPQLDRVVQASRGQRFAAGAIRHGTHPMRVSL